MKMNKLLILYVALLSLMPIASSFVLESLAISSTIAVAYFVRCTIYECCDDKAIPRRINDLWANLSSKLYGQQIARDLVFTAIRSHVFHDNPKKPLVLSFHGLPGSGKNYVSSMIANALYSKGEKSSHYHFFNGRNDFPKDENVHLYKKELHTKVTNALNECPRAMFVFDEVDKMPAGVLDILVPFLDYTNWINKEKNKAIFIFLSNSGSELILQRMLNLWKNGKDRNDITIKDFESLIELGAFNEIGGLHKSATIESKLIDHHVPFLPLEEEHIRQCVVDVFAHWGKQYPSDIEIQNVMSFVSYGPTPHKIYSTSGCKKLDHKVTLTLFGKDFSDYD